jgi:hypothetical protein
MATHGDIGLSQPAASTITLKLRSVTLDLNSTVVHQEVMTLGGAESSLEIARVQATAPASTVMALAVRIAGGPSSAADATFRVNQGLGNSSAADIWNVNMRSSAANALVSVYQSTASDLLATVTPASGSTWRTQPGSTAWASSAGFHFDSSGALQVTGATASTVVTVARMVGNSSASDYMPVRIVDSSGTGFLSPGVEYTDGSTTSTLAAPGVAFSNSSNDTMRLVGIANPLPVQLTRVTPTLLSTTTLITSTASTALYTLVSSAAVRQKVYGYMVTSTHTVPSTMIFWSSNSIDRWHVGFGSGSSGMTGANMVLSPPAWIFATDVSNALRVSIEGGSSGNSTVIARVSIAYFSEA